MREPRCSPKNRENSFGDVLASYAGMSPSTNVPATPPQKMASTRKAPSAALARFSPLSVARVIWKGRLLLLIVCITVTIAGALAVWRMKPTYRAETLILVESQKIPDKYVASTVVGDVQDRLATISQEILSSTRLKKIIDDYKLYPQERMKSGMEDVIESMRHDVDVKLEKGWSSNRPGAFRISYEGSDPTVVAAVANRIASLYIDENLKVREDQAEDTSQFLDAQLKDAKKTLDDLEAAVSRYKVEHNGELPQQENTINTTLMRLQTELQGTQEAVNRAQQNKVIFDAELSTIETRLSTLTAAAESTAAAPPQPRAASDRAAAPEPPKRSQTLSAELMTLRARYSDEYPEVKRVKAALEEALQAEQQQTLPPAAPKQPPVSPPPRPTAAPQRVVLSAEAAREFEQLRQQDSTLKAQRAIADREIENGTARRESILSEMAGYQAQLKRLPIREQEMAALTRDYETAKSNYRSLLDKKTSADMATEMERRQKAERFMVLDPAQVPEKPSKPKRGLLMALSAVLGLAAGIAAVIGKEWNKNLLLGEWELPPGVPILGRIPQIDVFPSGENPHAGHSRRANKQLLATALLLTLLARAAARHLIGGLL